MKKLLLLSLGVLAFGVMSASADSGDSRGFRFDCRFTGSGAKKGTGQCELKARVCEFSRGTHDVLDQSLEECRDAMLIACNGQEVFRGFAAHHANDDFEFIKGDSNSQKPPILKYEGDQHHGKSHFTISAWLLNDGSILNGFCFVHAPKLD